MIPVVLSWSGGKDSMLALRELRRSPEHRVLGLLTTLTREHDRISIHGVRRELLEAQAAALGLPLTIASIPAECTNERYEAEMVSALTGFARRGAVAVAFGDLFLSDIRAYREALTARAGLTALFPIWGRDTRRLVHDFIDAGFRAILTCVDSQAIDPAFAGRDLDHRLLRELPDSADPCGENGEFHTFVTAGPELSRPIPVARGEHVLRNDRFVFCDLLPAPDPRPDGA